MSSGERSANSGTTTSAGLSVAWPRYFVPTFLLGAVLGGVGLFEAGRLLGQATKVGNR